VTDDRPLVAVFRPDDERLRDAVETLRSLGAEAVPDPLLAIDPTGDAPRGAEYVVFTSKTGAEIAAAAGWSPDGATVCAIGPATAGALRDAGYPVDRTPDRYSSAGLVDDLAPRVGGATVEVARSDHGSATLLDGLCDAGADVTETVLYRLTRPPEAGRSTERAAAGALDAALFTSSLTVDHFLEAAADRGVRDEAVAGLSDAVVGAIGEPTRRTATDRGLPVDVGPDRATVDDLARAVVDRLG
jgi:uroporphyrinogen-III synthase